MVRYKRTTPFVNASLRRAFTMIELIFAIVIISVVVLTIPMMIQVNNKALEGNSAQEAIFLVSSVLSGATTRLWDENSSQSVGGFFTLSKMLDVAGGNALYNRVDTNSTIRIGGIQESMHRQFFSTPVGPTATDNTTISFDENALGEAFGLKNSYDLTIKRIYVSDTPDTMGANTFVFSTTAATGQTNIKMLDLSVTAIIDGNVTEITRLRAYTCNIGEIDIAKRRF